VNLVASVSWKKAIALQNRFDGSVSEAILMKLNYPKDGQ
jgi:hypothetical protein